MVPASLDLICGILETEPIEGKVGESEASGIYHVISVPEAQRKHSCDVVKAPVGRGARGYQYHTSAFSNQAQPWYQEGAQHNVTGRLLLVVGRITWSIKQKKIAESEAAGRQTPMTQVSGSIQRVDLARKGGGCTYYRGRALPRRVQRRGPIRRERAAPWALSNQRLEPPRQAWVGFVGLEGDLEAGGDDLRLQEQHAAVPPQEKLLPGRSDRLEMVSGGGCRVGKRAMKKGNSVALVIEALPDLSQ
ncbi:hypothetical protein B0T17DRAFT_510254 [Bombardia bombarda]|uniref:Uncharacterized protein n=1 Tax=Bombardia bombarda TaxID=252184 RepID=A0AA39WHT9_9PEZI|nr:hypothetical protein B0T17DRAFT_510254 [Bombardia bombarda]